MNKREALVLTAYTGFMCVEDFSEFHAFAEEVLGRPVWTHQFADPKMVEMLKDATHEEFLNIVKNVKD